MLASYSIRTKIIAVVAFLLVAMTGMGLLAVMNMRSINANTVDISKNWLPSVRVLGDLRAGVITYRNVIREHMLVQTLEEKQAMEKTLASVVESNSKIRATFEQLIASSEERAMYSEWVKLWESYKKGTEEVMALSRKAVGQAAREAHELNTKTVNKIGLDADAVLKKGIDLNNTGADKAAQGQRRHVMHIGVGKASAQPQNGGGAFQKNTPPLDRHDTSRIHDNIKLVVS